LHVNKDIILCEENKIINNQNEVAETFNNMLYKCRQSSQDIIIDESHPSIKVIEENKTEIKDLSLFGKTENSKDLFINLEIG
jgi:hypothetical protein